MQRSGRPPWLLTPDFEMTFFSFLVSISHLRISDGSEERCQFGVKGRALQLLKELSLTEIQSASGLEQLQGSGEGFVILWGPSCTRAPPFTWDGCAPRSLASCSRLGPSLRAKPTYPCTAWGSRGPWSGCWESWFLSQLSLCI